jgi:hypothetical protein
MWHVWEERSGVCKVLVEIPQGNIPLGIPRCRGKDYIKMDLQEVRMERSSILTLLGYGHHKPA